MVTKVSGAAQARADDYAQLRTQLAAGDYAVGTLVQVLNPDGPPLEVKKGIQTDDGGVIITENGGTTGATQFFAERTESEQLSALWFGTSADIAVRINAAFDAGHTTQFIPPDTYTQFTEINKTGLVLYSSYWDEFGTSPAVFVQDAGVDIVQLTSSGVTSLGVRYDGNSAGTKSGVVLHGKSIFIGQVVSQALHGLHLEERAGDNLNNSMIGGAFSGSAVAQILIENTDVQDSNNIDLNVITFLTLRCNTGRIGFHMRGGLFNRFTLINTKGNTEIGVFLEALNDISANEFRIYSENSAAGVVDFFAIDGLTVGTTPTFVDATNFTLVGDQTSTYIPGKKIRVTDAGVDFWGTVVTSVFTATTNVNVLMHGLVPLTAGLTAQAFDKDNNNFQDNIFIQSRGLTAVDINVKRGNVFWNASALQGIIVNSQQPFVQANLGGSDLTNVTGNGTPFNIPFDTKVKDTQGDFDFSTGIYTNRTSSFNLFGGSVRLQGLAAGGHTRVELNLVTTGTTYSLFDSDLDQFKSANDIAVINWNAPIFMASNDTAQLRLEVTGGALDVDISGGTGQTWITIANIH